MLGNGSMAAVTLWLIGIFNDPLGALLTLPRFFEDTGPEAGATVENVM